MGNKSSSPKLKVLKWWQHVVLSHTTRGEGLTYNTDLTDHTIHAFQTDEVAYSSLNFYVQAPEKSASASPPPTATDTVYSEVQKK